MDHIETKGNTFWVLIESNKENMIIFNQKDTAIEKLSEADDPNSVQIISLTKQGKEWAIEQVSWQEIASALIRKARK